MSDRRDELLRLRKTLLMGDPPYEFNEQLNMKRRTKGTPGYEELRAIGNYGPGAGPTILLFETIVAIIDLMLERTR